MCHYVRFVAVLNQPSRCFSHMLLVIGSDGLQLAKAIVDPQEFNGDHVSVNQILQVSLIGPKFNHLASQGFWWSLPLSTCEEIDPYS